MVKYRRIIKKTYVRKIIRIISVKKKVIKKRPIRKTSVKRKKIFRTRW